MKEFVPVLQNIKEGLENISKNTILFWLCSGWKISTNDYPKVLNAFYDNIGLGDISVDNLSHRELWDPYKG